MQYLGGKSRISKHIAEIINSEGRYNEIPWRQEQDSKRYSTINQSINQSPTFVSLFCGTCSIESKVNTKNKILNDKHEYLIEMFKGVQKGYDLQNYISKEEYKRIRENKDADKILSGFVGFGCSFGGKWFGGYAQNKTETNYTDQSKRSLLKDMNGLWEAEFLCKDYRDVEIPEGAIIYCDPPYI